MCQNSERHKIIRHSRLHILAIKNALVRIGPEFIQVAHIVFTCDCRIEAQGMQVIDRVLHHHVVGQDLVIPP